MSSLTTNNTLLDITVKMAPGVSYNKEIEIAQAEAPKLKQVTWYRDPGLRKLYACCAIVCLASATTGYDGSMVCIFTEVRREYSSILTKRS